ncbi:hypothetical protein FB548_1157 [Pseudoxanthomonas sp. 3HH-4]|nr:hypothetical protein FB548_1157 [Pseudoxanthomonas sp. 3HH-4]
MTLRLPFYCHPGAGRDPATSALPVPEALGPGLRRDDGEKHGSDEMERSA